MNEQSLLDVNDVGPYLIHSYREIIALMRRLSSHREQVRMIFSHGEEALATSVLLASESGVVVSSAYDPDLTARILACNNISFDTALDKVRIVFFARSIRACTYENQPALHIDLPDSIVRLQRREFYRVMTSRCAIQIEQPNGHGPYPIGFTVQNVSAGGIALIDEQGALDATTGREYRKCELTLQGAKKLIVSLRVMNSTPVTLPGNRPGKRIGFCFVNLSPAEMMVIQRSVSQVEREQIALRD